MEDGDLHAMEAAVRAGAITEGQITRAFEAQYARLLGATGAVATNSGTSALVLALAVLGVGTGDEVVLPSYTCLALLNAVAQVGATPRLADNAYAPERMDFNMTAETARAVLSSKTRAILVPHMFGVPAEVDRIADLGLPVIEDVTLSLGAVHRGKPVGVWGAMSVCSFHASKMMACGEGGMLACNTPALHETAAYLNGWEAEQAALRLREDDGPYRLRYNFRLTDIAAALGLSQLQKLPRFIERRRALAARYTACLSGTPRVTLPSADSANVFHRYLAACEERDIPASIRQFARAGVEVGRGVYPPLHRYLGEDRGRYAGAERAVHRLLSIPLYPALTDQQVAHVLKTTKAILAA